MKTAAAPTAYRRQAAPAGALRLDANEGPAPGRTSGAGGRPTWRPCAAIRTPAALEADLAARYGVDPAQVLVTAGGDDAIDRLCRRFVGGGRGLVLTEPTFVDVRAATPGWPGAVCGRCPGGRGRIRCPRWPRRWARTPACWRWSAPTIPPAR